MPPFKASGYGRQVFDSFPPLHVGGRSLIVGSSTVPGRETTQRIFGPDTFGHFRFYNTLALAVAAAQASRDTIYVMAGHTETISSATALSLSVAGIQVVGMGVGSQRPTFTLDTATTATINITAANVSFKNCIFVANFAAIAAVFTLTTATDFKVDQCEFRDTSAILNFVNIVTTSTTSNQADGLTIRGCKRLGLGATSNTTIVNMLGTNDRVSIGMPGMDSGNFFTHKATTDGGLMIIATGKVVTNLIARNNVCLFTGASGSTGGVLITTNGSTNSGFLSENNVQALDATTPILITASSGFVFGLNYYTHTADKSGYLVPAIDS